MRFIDRSLQNYLAQTFYIRVSLGSGGPLVTVFSPGVVRGSAGDGGLCGMGSMDLETLLGPPLLGLALVLDATEQFGLSP